MPRPEEFSPVLGSNPQNGNAATADVTGLLTNQDQSVQGLQRVNYTSPASPENLRSLGQKLCLWHPKKLLSGMDQLGQAVVAHSPTLGSRGGHTEDLGRVPPVGMVGEGSSPFPLHPLKI